MMKHALLMLFFAAPAFAAISEQAAVKRAQQAIARGHWTSVETKCLSFQSVEPKWSFVVREEHNEACGGDRMTAPRLFDVHVDPQTGVVRRED